jgi:rubrerythrin
MKSLKGTQTEKNILTAFSGESQARNRYTFFASQAKKEGYVQISKVFEETADQEKEHAKRLFKFLEGGDVQIIGTFPAGIIGTTEQNLISAAKGEDEEWQHMYPDYAKVAKAEGFNEIAEVMLNIAKAEKQHSKRYQGFLKNIQNGTVFKKDGKVFWKCLNCGFVYEGDSAPEKCPACAQPQAYFELLAENW